MMLDRATATESDGYRGVTMVTAEKLMTSRETRVSAAKLSRCVELERALKIALESPVPQLVYCIQSATDHIVRSVSAKSINKSLTILQ